MKVLIVTPSYKPAYIYGGPTFSVSYLAQEINSSVNELLLLTTTANGKEELDVQTSTINIVDGVPVIYFNRQTKDHSHLSFGLIRYLWNNCSKYDVVHIQSWWNLVALLSALICLLKDKKYVVSPRGMLSEYTLQSSFSKKIIHFLIGDYLLKRSCIHATSNNEIKQIQNLNPKYKVKYAPNFIYLNNNIFTKESNPVKQLLFLSRIHQKKGLETLFKALSKVEYPYVLHIVGDGEKSYIEELKKLSTKLNINHSIQWHGSLYDDEKYKMYANADVMILPSKDENFANNVLESLSMGTAVIVSDKVGLSEFVKEHNLGWVFDGTDFGLFISLEEVFNNPLKLNNIRLSAKEIVSKEFNVDTIRNQYLKMYQD